MLLALSEACPKQPKSLEEALCYSRDALNLFQEARDEKMEAAGWLTTARLLMTKKGDKEEALKEAWQATCDALTIFQRLRDVKGEAEALHTQAEVKAADSKFLEAVEVAQDALDLFQDLELKKQEAFELQHIAGLLVAAGMPRKSLEFAEEALEIIRSSKGSAKKEVEALGLVVRALIARERPKKAVEVGTKGLKRFQKDGENLDAQAEAKATMIVQEAYQASGDKIKKIWLVRTRYCSFML
jgi:tetratricopeptide (TPR) repeat protein